MTMKSGPAAVAPTEARLVLVQENSLELLEKLGSGAFGTVYRVKKPSFVDILVVICSNNLSGYLVA